MSDSPYTAYTVDWRDHIVTVSGAWAEFAADNGGCGLEPADIVGRPIREFVHGDIARMWLTTLFQRTRLARTTIEHQYRCDSPALRRMMIMRVIPQVADALLVEHRLLRTEARRVPLAIRTLREGDRDRPELRCSVCGRIRHRFGWAEPDATPGVQAGDLVVVYSVCADCYRQLPTPP